ncbi:macro domain-containing protein [Microbacterium sp. SL62]|uniref:macro domain-containing protein n=1 Tax=Microbacterium sp. SL62 TaxID=2995139 RepID=UPI002275CF3D|nr:macro domain-containing protein [Microbacterium sp. SL62]MCY1718536.1 macro domain-containing protein [Microbacterium sp. SL62]
MTVAEVVIEHRRANLFEVRADAIVNPWNRNFVPRWLLRPGGVSGELKKRTGPAPWRDLRARGVLRLGEAVITDAGHYPNAHAIIHVAGINARWRASEESVRLSTRNAVRTARAHGLGSMVMPLIGAGHGGLDPKHSLDATIAALEEERLVVGQPRLVVTIADRSGGR